MDAAPDLSLAFDDAMASGMDVASSPQSIAPFMVGDSFGISSNYLLGFATEDGQVSANDSTGLAGGRRLKIAESTSPLPRNRVFFTYNLFRDAYQTSQVALGEDGPSRSFDLNRFTFGIEKTFFDGLTSVELRLPFSRTLSSDLSVNSFDIPGEVATELDNVSATFKALLFNRPRLAISTGVSVNTPTADPVRVNNFITTALGGQVLSHELTLYNHSVHMLPFIGFLATPTDRFFSQGYVQLEAPLNSNRVTFTPINGGVVDPTQVGHMADQAIFYADLALGYWLYRNDDSWLRGIAPIMEFHYTSTIQNARLVKFTNNVNGSNFVGFVGNTLNRIDITNLTMALSTQVGDRGFITNGFVVPLQKRDGNNQFDWEYNLQLNYQYGPITRPSTAPIFQ